MPLTKHDFTAPGRVSLWVTARPVSGFHPDFLEGCDQLFMWLMVDFDVAINGSFATNFSRDGNVKPLGDLLYDLHGSDSFSAAAVARAAERGIDQASFVVALYDFDYEPAKLGMAADHQGSPWLAFVGAFSVEA